MYYEFDKKITQLLKSEKFQEALDELNKIEPTDERIFRLINLKKARLAAELGKFLLATVYITSAKEGCEKNQLYYQILSEEAKIAFQEEDYKKALSCCEEALQAGVDNNGIIYLTLGHTKKELGDYYEAIKAYRKAISSTKASSIKLACYYSLALLEVALGEFNLAEIDIKAYITEEGKITDKSNRILTGIYLRQGRYKDAAEHLKMLKRDYPQIKYDFAYSLMVEKGLGNPTDYLKPTSYLPTQMVNYSKEVAIDHIKCNHTSINDEESYFSSSIDISELFEEVQPQLTEDNVQYGLVSDLYQVPYLNAGYDDQGNIMNSIRVVTIAGTKDIITMYPSDKKVINSKDFLPKKPSAQKVARSRIEKFNDRLAKYQEKRSN